jgi:hypothetical protein
MGVLTNFRATMRRRLADRARAERANGHGPRQTFLETLDVLSICSTAERFFERSGWYLPLHAQTYRYALEQQRTLAPFHPGQAAALVGPRSPHWAWICAGLRASPSLAARRAILDDALFCLEQTRWHAAVSTLLPITEGMVGDRNGLLETLRVPRRLTALLETPDPAVDMAALMAIPALALLDGELLVRTPRGDVAVDPASLDRDVILRGRGRGFGDEPTALRALMVVAALAELVDGPLVFRTSENGLDERLLDADGPLAGLRAVARARRAGFNGRRVQA